MDTKSIRDELLARSAELRSILAQASLSMPRLFGSVARGEDDSSSDIDLLVDAGSNCTLLDLSQAQDDLEDWFGRRFDLVTVNGLHPTIRSQAIAEAIAL